MVLHSFHKHKINLIHYTNVSTCKKSIRDLIDQGRIRMVYSEEYKLPTCVPYIIQGSGTVSRDHLLAGAGLAKDGVFVGIVEQLRLPKPIPFRGPAQSAGFMSMSPTSS